MTKFPGGGLEKGEGIANCLVREFMEELNIQVSVGDFFYVNDFLQLSAFNPNHQLISFYYFVSTTNEGIKKITHLCATRSADSTEQTFEWVQLDQLAAADFTFPIDSLVAEKLSKIR